MDSVEKKSPIQFNCYFTRSRAGEQFVPEHSLGYVVSGAIDVFDGDISSHFTEGDVYFCRRARLGKYTKHPGENGEFRSVSVYFDQEMLRSFSWEYPVETVVPVQTPAFSKMPSNTILTRYMESLRSYEQALSTPNVGTSLIAVKQKEALLLLLQLKPMLRHVLFDFSVPGKIDLEGFMNRNYHFKVALERFAFLTGRSLSTFKRDFEKTFHQTPNRWLLQRRLKEAHHLITGQGKTASEVYLDLGFEDLSHFSFAFKKAYGIAPSRAEAVRAPQPGK